MSSRTHYQTVVVSDIHLGSALCLVAALWDALKKITFNRIIINGDLFEAPSLHHFPTEHLRFLLWLRDIGVEIILIPGNHDRDTSLTPRNRREWEENTSFIRVVADLIGAKLVREYEWHWNGQKCLAMHGDRYDRSLSSRRISVWFGTLVHSIAARYDYKDWRVTRWLKTWLRDNAERLEKKVVQIARRRGASVAFAGHVHLLAKNQHDGVLYVNTGSCTDGDRGIGACGEREVDLLRY